MESNDFGRAVGMFSASRDLFDVWFEQELAAVTGVDLNNMPADFAPPELLSRYDGTPLQRTT